MTICSCNGSMLRDMLTRGACDYIHIAVMDLHSEIC